MSHIFSRFPDRELLTVEGSGHDVRHDCLEVVNPPVINFLAGS